MLCEHSQYTCVLLAVDTVYKSLDTVMYSLTTCFTMVCVLALNNNIFVTFQHGPPEFMRGLESNKFGDLGGYRILIQTHIVIYAKEGNVGWIVRMGHELMTCIAPSVRWWGCD